jgi:hypothetical protein
MTPEFKHEHRSASAYLKQAAEQLMEEQKFHPASDVECLEWMRKKRQGGWPAGDGVAAGNVEQVPAARCDGGFDHSNSNGGLL